MKKLLLISLAAMPLTGCMTASRIALALAPTASIAVNERVAEHCVGATQSGRPVDQRRQVRAEFAGIAYDTEIGPRTTQAQQEGVNRGRELRRQICPPLPMANAPAPIDPEVSSLVEPLPPEVQPEPQP